jgi:hypothetical protein
MYGQKLSIHVDIYVSVPEKKLKKPRYNKRNLKNTGQHRVSDLGAHITVPVV